MTLSLRRFKESVGSGRQGGRWQPNVYLTDGTDLFRTLPPPIFRSEPGFLALEDCRTLEVTLCSFEDLAGRDLRAVR